MLIEHDYVDRDHRSAASRFYSQQFRATARLCRRYHFFAAHSRWAARPGQKPPELGEYLGYIVRRPVPQAPIGRTVLKFPTATLQGAYLSCAAEFKPHINETELSVTGVPYCQQDAVIMSCAETSIWTAARVMTKVHRHPLVLGSQIATADTVGFLSAGRVLPSPGLTPEQMSHVLSALGFGTIYYAKEAFDGVIWDPVEIAAPYLASGIPVILVGNGHAVTACGALIDIARAEKKPAETRAVSDWIDALITQDDAQGPYRILPRGKNDDPKLRQRFDDLMTPESTKRSARTAADVTAILVPLEPKMFLNAKDANVIARGYLGGTQFNNIFRPRLERLARFGVSSSRELLNAVSGDHGGIVYLLRCRRSVDVRNELAKQGDDPAHPLRHVLRDVPLPRYIWTVEFTTQDRYRNRDSAQRRIFGRLYLDSTATEMAGANAVIVAHFPGMAVVRPRISRAGGNADTTSHLLLEDYGVVADNTPFWH